jgi:hypothetical protein
MQINKIAFLLIFTIIFSIKLKAQDSTNVQDPQPVVITQDGYSPEMNPENIPLNERSFTQRLKYGGGFGPFSFSNFQTIIGLSPMVGYQLTDHTIVGVGASMIFLRQQTTFSNIKEKQDLYGFSGFIRQDLVFTQKINFPLYVTAEATQFQGIQQKYDLRPSLLVGLGMGNAGGYGLQVLWDLNYKADNRSFSGQFNDFPLVIRVTGFFN